METQQNGHLLPNGHSHFVYQSYNSTQHTHIHIEHYMNFIYHPHLHQDFEFVLLLNGNIDVITPGRRETMQPGQLALLLPNQIHGFETPSRSETLIVNFSTDLVGAFTRQIKRLTGEKCVFNSSETLNAYLCDIYLGSSPIPPQVLTYKASFYAVCARFMDCVPLVNAQETHDDVLSRLLLYVENNFTDDISLKTAARAIGYNENYISRCLHQTVNINFRRYVNNLRINYACHLLEQEKPQVARIAHLCGFQSIRSFNRAFLESIGMTPREYIKQ